MIAKPVKGFDIAAFKQIDKDGFMTDTDCTWGARGSPGKLPEYAVNTGRPGNIVPRAKSGIYLPPGYETKRDS